MNKVEADRRTVRLRIEGRVQGVGFRHWTSRVAAELDLDGWVRNRRDGTVEALVCGAPADVAQMLALCRGGPPGASVAAVEVVDDEVEPPAGFCVLATV
jgi:acylphosphatase